MKSAPHTVSLKRARIPNHMAIIAFLESRDFEDAIRNAISLGGDSDTLAAITGSIAEGSFYCIPDLIKEKAYSYLDESLKDIIMRWELYIARKWLYGWVERWHRWNYLTSIKEKVIDVITNILKAIHLKNMKTLWIMSMSQRLTILKRIFWLCWKVFRIEWFWHDWWVWCEMSFQSALWVFPIGDLWLWWPDWLCCWLWFDFKFWISRYGVASRVSIYR